MHVVESERLRLVALEAPLLRAFADSDLRLASELLKAQICDDCTLLPALAKMRLEQLLEDAAILPWLLRAMVRKSDDQMVGYLGFHASPTPDYLLEYSNHAVEIGYSVDAPFRRNVYAFEAVTALLQWASVEEPGIEFVASIAPHNVASLGLLNKLALAYRITKVGYHIDVEDGHEDIYLMQSTVTLT